MLKIGEKQELIIIKQVDFGVYLAEVQGSDDKVLLPKKQVPEGAELGDKLTVFLYRDSDDRLIATTKTPKLMLGDVNMLTVTDVGKIGAFMDWGLEKDVLLPFREQTRKVKKGEDVLIPVDMPDKYLAEMVMDRIAASKVYEGKKYTNASALHYFNSGIEVVPMHPLTKKKLKRYLLFLAKYGEEKLYALLRHDLKYGMKV